MLEPAKPVPLTLAEQRILGVLIEKQKTTPDVYPMTINGLVVGCNQKSNRDPVLSLTEDDVADTLEVLHKRQLVVRVQSGRVDKWKHVLYEMWGVEKTELAVLAELFVRGPQTEGELRTRVSRMDPVADLDALKAILHHLAERGFVVYLTPEGRRGTIVGHGCMEAGMLDSLRKRYEEGVRLDEAARPAYPAGTTRPAPPASELDEVRKELAELRTNVESLTLAVKNLQEQLGVSG